MVDPFEETQVNPELPRLLAQQATLGSRQQVRDGQASRKPEPVGEGGRTTLASAGIVAAVFLLAAVRLITRSHIGS
jgi:hypothetical protein